ncbi:MAG TPA: hypothetical protein LFW21_01760 [Rickettsia endosymbiont of Pyrocoelia pectoralis]|nr:hypothetical protein [Rickettsia endosymbiont of Pyrocoelia pectoralis]
MFNFLEMFGSGVGIFAAGSSLVNSYAQLRASKERNKEAIYEQQSRARALEQQKRFNARDVKQREAEYNEICSYNIDMLRQNQLMARQQLGYNILKSGVGITGFDSAGLLLKHQAYMDEMKARSVEAEYYHNRPRINFDQGLFDLQKEAISRNIKNIKQASPWSNIGAIAGGVRDLTEIARIYD